MDKQRTIADKIVCYTVIVKSGYKAAPVLFNRILPFLKPPKSNFKRFFMFNAIQRGKPNKTRRAGAGVVWGSV